MDAIPAAGELLTDGDEQLLDTLQASVYPDCERPMLLHVVRYCRALGLDPILRPVHVLARPAPRSGVAGAAIVPGIGLYRAIAARCGCAGIEEPQFGPETSEQFGAHRLAYPAWCRVTVRRRLACGDVALFTACEFWRENVAWEPDGQGAAVPNDVWRRRPYGQLAKCAEAQALRRGFPEVGAQPLLDELSGSVGQGAADGEGGAPARPARRRTAARTPVAMPQPRRNPEAPAPAAASEKADLSQGSLLLEPAANAIGGASPPDQASAGGQCRRQDASEAGPARPADAIGELQDRPALNGHAVQKPLPVEPDRWPEAGLQMPAVAVADAAAAAAALPDEPAGEGGSGRITQGERACLQRRLQAKGWSFAQARQAAGLPAGATLDDLTRSGVAALLEVAA